MAVCRISCRVAVPASVRAHAVGKVGSSFSGANGSADRGTSGRRPQRNPSAMVLNSSRARPGHRRPSPHVRDHHGRRMEVRHRR